MIKNRLLPFIWLPLFVMMVNWDAQVEKATEKGILEPARNLNEYLNSSDSEAGNDGDADYDPPDDSVLLCADGSDNDTSSDDIDDASQPVLCKPCLPYAFPTK
jgi:hypothetical protein